MYTNFFSLSEQPFSIAPDPKYLFMSDRHREALSHLTYGLGCSNGTSNGGFVLLTGEVGTGKTTVSRCLMADLPDDTQLAFILNPTLSSQELLATICDQLKIRYRKTGATLKTLTDKISEKLLKNHSNNINTLLIIDEAQHLAPDVLEQLRLLTNLETNTKKLLQVILIGQPELQQLLKRRDLRQLAQRITARYHLLPLDKAELALYIKHRLSVADCHRALFNESALALIHQLSQGIPRLVNLICHSALMEAYNSNNAVVDKKIVYKAACNALGDDLLPNPWWQTKSTKIVLMTSLLFLVLIAGFLLGQKEPLLLVNSELPEKAALEEIPVDVKVQPEQPVTLNNVPEKKLTSLNSTNKADDSVKEVIVQKTIVEEKPELQSSGSLLEAVQKSVKQFEGAYGTVVLDSNTPEKVVVARSGSPLVIGLGLDENFIASDMMALLPVTRNFMFLEEGDVAQITRFDVDVYDVDGQKVERESKEHDISHEAGDKGEYRHFMMKEIFEQPTAVRNTLENGFNGDELNLDAFGVNAKAIFDDIEHVQIIACGTSYHSGMVARYWLESLANVSCSVEIASEFLYRKSFVPKKSLIVTLSQSGETADTLAALRLAKEIGYQSSLCICNVPGSSLVRESDLVFLTKAGVEIGVASTKAFTTQLVGLLMMTVAIGRSRGMSEKEQKSIIQSLKALPNTLESTLTLDKPIELLAEDFADKHHSLFLGRGAQYPIAMEGALKLKEISYIHAEAYAAGELKHGPLALIDAQMPVIVVAPNNELLEKLKSNVEEVRARGGLMYVFADVNARFESDETLKVLNVVHCDDVVAPIVYTLPLQLLSYYVAIIKGTDVDQPRNLAKSVTVE